MNTIYLFCLISTFAIVINGQTQCRDESGSIVDWYVVYKFPNISKANTPLETGLKYAYITSNSKLGWTLSSQVVTDSSKSIFAKTLQSVYTENSTVSHINYNDQPPNGTVFFDGAHAKGVVVADDTQGFWLIHTVPKFTSDEDIHLLVYPSSGARYGQVALCISFNITEFDKIIEQLLYMESNIYTIKISPTLAKKSLLINDLENVKWRTGDFNIRSIMSSSGVNFTSFSKNPYYSVDLYSDIVAANLNTSLYVESWRQSGVVLPSQCSKANTVENINQITLQFENSNQTAYFGYKDDHSKWAISKTSTHPYVCVGDMNRMESQARRGGATTCFQSSLVWKNFNQWITQVEKCGA